jgi:hypothetical protein
MQSSPTNAHRKRCVSRNFFGSGCFSGEVQMDYGRLFPYSPRCWSVKVWALSQERESSKIELMAFFQEELECSFNWKIKVKEEEGIFSSGFV